MNQHLGTRIPTPDIRLNGIADLVSIDESDVRIQLQMELNERLEKKKTVLAVREIKDKKIIRASPHFFNSEVEIQKVVDEIKKL